MGNLQTINEMYMEDIKSEVSLMQKYSNPDTFYVANIQRHLYEKRFTNRFQTVHWYLHDLAQDISKNMTRDHIVITHRRSKGQIPIIMSIRMSAAPDDLRPLPPPPKSYNELYLEAIKDNNN